MEPKGITKLICQFKNNEAEIEFQDIEKDLPAILGKSVCTELGLVKRIDKVDCEENTDILKEFDDVFNGLGCIPGVYHIKIDPTVAPGIHPPRKVPIPLKDQIKTELNRMERLGVIKKQTEPTNWVNSMVTVVKPNKLRICIDPKYSNKAIKRVDEIKYIGHTKWRRSEARPRLDQSNCGDVQTTRQICFNEVSWHASIPRTVCSKLESGTCSGTGKHHSKRVLRHLSHS